ncbi:MAG: helix-turn-helix transcriptional regulator [Bacteroidales bacterium]|nr:helix-turn-helix transcriptional regulator [Bacteroidales bacterium]MCQ2973314.1 helix-turn-helix transcriptional regulator [Bacteroidales bacterium]
MLLEINKAFFEYIKPISSEDYIKYSISYNYRFISKTAKFLINQTYAPIQIRNGKIWLALCTVTLSSRSTSGNIILKKNDSDIIYTYSVENHCWKKQQKIKLTLIEKLIIRYSAQGLTNSQISNKILKSENSIKSYKKRLYKKLQVHSITEAIVFSQNQALL